MSPRKESGDVSPALQICFRGWADFCTPRTGALQIALFGGLEAPKVLASGRPLLAHVDPSTAREVDRPLRRAMLNKSRLCRHYLNIEQAAFAALRRAKGAALSTFAHDAIARGISGAKKSLKKNQKKSCVCFPVLIQAQEIQTNSRQKKV